jgi:LysR family hydrogen peroxide-inducible transcriptional activator
MTKRPTLRQLEYFVSVANTLNFRNSAHHLKVSQPTLTAQIATLEQNLGVILFERSRSGTMLSVHGRELLIHAKEMLNSLHSFEEVALSLANGVATTFKLGVPPTSGPYLLPNVLPDLHKIYDKLRLYVREDPPRLLVEKLLQGVYDIILTPLPYKSDNLAVDPLFSEPLKFVVPADHPLSNQNNIAPSQMRGQKVLTIEEQHHFHQQVQDICSELHAEVLRDFEGTSLDTLRQMVVMGLGVAFLPGLYIHSELHKPEALHVCEIANMPIVREHALIWRNTSPNRVFFRELAAQIRKIIHSRLSGVVTPL